MVDARRAVRRALVGAGAAALLAGALWRPIAVPLLVKFPTDLDQATRYDGTFSVYVDPATGAPLPSPIELPLELERRIRTVPEQSGARTVVVQELVTFRIAGTEQRETHQYVMDRRSMENLDDPRSYAYDPANVVDRRGTHRVNLPLSTKDDGRYRIWENEPGEAFHMTGLARRVDREDLSLVEMEEVFGDVPVADYYRDELRKQGFTTEITFEVLAARLRAAGVDVDGALTALETSEPTVVGAARTASLPLRFFRSNDGHALVEPRTGAIVDLLASEEGITAAVDLAPLAEIRRALAREGGPAAAALAAAFDEIEAAAPAPVYDLRYSQTSESVAELVDLTRGELRKLDLAERWVPLLLGGAGIALLAVGAIWPRPHGQQRPARRPAPEPRWSQVRPPRRPRYARRPTPS
jgi:hypothetical protein